MNMREQLIFQFNSKINELQAQIDNEENKKILELKKIVTKLQDKIVTILLIKKEGKKLSKDIKLTKEDILILKNAKLLDLFPSLSSDFVDKIDHYLKLSGMIFFDLNKEEILINLKNMLDKIEEQVVEKTAKFSILNNEKENLQLIVKSLEDDYENIFNTHINQIVDFLKDRGNTEVEILSILRELVIDIELNLSQSKESKKNKIDIVENNTEEEVEIFEENRYNFISKIISTISSQVVILSTDSEFVGKNLEIIEDRIHKKYLLDYDEKSAKTTVTEDYFGGEVA